MTPFDVGESESPRPKQRPQGRAVRLVRLNGLLGAGLGTAAAASLLAADFGGLMRLIAAGRDPAAALILLGAGFATLFGAVVAAGAVMLIPDTAAAGDGGRRARDPAAAPAVAPVRVRSSRPR
jgi:hypothetical protein